MKPHRSIPLKPLYAFVGIVVIAYVATRHPDADVLKTAIGAIAGLVSVLMASHAYTDGKALDKGKAKP